MEFAPDGGAGWRQDVGTFLRDELGFEPFDPCVNELEVLDPEERQNFRRWKAEDRDRFLQVIRRIIHHDLTTLCERTGFVVCLWDEHCQKGAGTAGELTVAHLHNIPVYLVTSVPPSSLSSWVVGCATEVFPDFDSLKRYLRTRYEVVQSGPCNP